MSTIVYITGIPSFYKINLFNRIAIHRDLLVIFTHDRSTRRNEDFYLGERKFSHITIAEKSIVGKVRFICHLIKEYNYEQLILCGWDQWILWVAAILSPKVQNAIVVESSILESETKGLKGFIKRLFISRISKAYVSGSTQLELIRKLGFNGRAIMTLGVGVFNIIPQPAYRKSSSIRNFIFVGRLAPEKNIQLLVKTFNEFPNLTLNIIGYGPQEQLLRSIANKNIVFHGAVPNSELFKVYQQNDVFILPSISEPWGLVVEEALNCGLPVIVSNKVGCAEEIVNDSNGIVFNLSESEGLRNAIIRIQDFKYYNMLRQNISKLNFSDIVEKQVNCYL